jgi:hypothetical protein
VLEIKNILIKAPNLAVLCRKINPDTKQAIGTSQLSFSTPRKNRNNPEPLSQNEQQRFHDYYNNQRMK